MGIRRSPQGFRCAVLVTLPPRPYLPTTLTGNIPIDSEKDPNEPATPPPLFSDLYCDRHHHRAKMCKIVSCGDGGGSWVAASQATAAVLPGLARVSQPQRAGRMLFESVHFKPNCQCWVVLSATGR